ncbi:hypothetical protein PHMEG_00015790 [Phytophthora megakarya]|uniref:MULE transposase domain-containing protein n=1 Tax=Phytophthora megakarya TaxID=4795 RepID=A0A225W1X0_9STRA|nr:hypothetical protein PHMEG_00015790 [Phytophthora megakarya]
MVSRVLEKGNDEDPFVVGISTLHLRIKINQFRQNGHFTLFHIDATFKLSDLGYTVITCSFTDRTRTYHLAAILIVSARTYREYDMAFKSFTKLYQRVFEYQLRVDAIMGDAADAQFNAYRRISPFSESKYLMCFFHVLYNVHKRTRHLQTGPAVTVVSGIIDIHCTTSHKEFCTVRERVMAQWRMESKLSTFADYFEEQWIESRFWRWQIYHSPSSYATTNNPCEVFNATVKRHVQRKASAIRILIRSTVTLAGDVGSDVHSPSTSIAPPN